MFDFKIVPIQLHDLHIWLAGKIKICHSHKANRRSIIRYLNLNKKTQSLERPVLVLDLYHTRGKIVCFQFVVKKTSKKLLITPNFKFVYRNTNHLF